jgi:hypothetical protein
MLPCVSTFHRVATYERVSALPQRSSRWLAFALVAGYTAVAAIVGVILLTLGSPTPSPALPAPAPQVALATPPSPTTTTVPPTSSTTATTGFTSVMGPNGVVTAVPTGWPLGSCTTADCTQANDPANATRFLRFGASPSRSDSLLNQQAAYEMEFSAGRTNFQRVKLDAVTHHGHEAVDWEFEYDLNGVRRHVKTLLWRANGEDNWVYASSELQLWPATRDIYDRMADAAKP